MMVGLARKQLVRCDHTLVWLAKFCIRFYQSYVRCHLFGACKFHPSCSEYGLACIDRFGAFKGGWLTMRRVLRCHPLARGRFDLPPGSQAPTSPASER